ncbi:hypothetical protein [Novacetimonas hansenii]|uniref:Uncharacterized protein n=1 Tax=Novacetimonas hansenii TaxID=436 RepID=A0AAW5EVU6_NOVHA|nr:hypothetical protein [Novacetimonas hansenii]MCJ8354988.1 hypothetical protein [Novacetimonas hansenii]
MGEGQPRLKASGLTWGMGRRHPCAAPEITYPRQGACSLPLDLLLETVWKQAVDKKQEKFLGAAFFQKGGVFRSFLEKASPKTFIISVCYPD